MKTANMKMLKMWKSPSILNAMSIDWSRITKVTVQKNISIVKSIDSEIVPEAILY